MPGPSSQLETRAVALRVLLAVALGVAAALLISCGGSGKSLIPLADAGPLQSDFEAVAQAAESGDGSCTATESALLKTDQDFAALPTSVDSGLRSTLHQGIENLRTRALALCAQPLPQTTVTTTTPKTTSTTTPTTPTETESTETPSTPAPETEGPSGPGGGTQAPGETHVGEAEGGVGAGEGSGGASPGASPGGGQEAK
ncbi:MAG TPA: hypothetical protein VHW67_06000 [Solirubrobacteraceae bacterium]|jgi:hypothetical protein|nr:hypothetical protein [Solirubrobacteraceae bacterium]